MPVIEFRGAHLSGRWDRPPFSLAAQLKRAAKHGATWLTLTEVADGKRPAAVRLPGWTTGHDVDGPGGKRFDRGECAIMADDDTWRMVRFRSYVIGPDLGPGNRIIMAMALLEHRETGARFLLSTCHTPSSVEDSSWGAERGRQYRLAIERWRRIQKSWRRAFDPDGEMAVADWNLNFHLAWVRDWFRRTWTDVTGPQVRPKGGTHGPRLIDMALTRGIHTALSIRSSWGASDHRELWVDSTMKAPR